MVNLSSLALFGGIGLASLVLASADVAAKGDSYIVGATISGSKLSPPSSVSVALPENYDDMYEALPSPALANGTMGAWYDITLHYDFEESGHGRRDRTGKFNGVDYLYFPDAMAVGPGTWAPGWFRANPLLAAQLQRALGPTPPAAGSGSLAATTGSNDSPVVGAVLLVAAVAVFAWGGARRR